MAAGHESSRNRKRSGRISVAGLTPRPMAIPVVEERLGVLSDPQKRSDLALLLAETCYECFWAEKLFRELIDCTPHDYDAIQTALVNLDISFDHIRRHMEELKGSLVSAIKALDLKLDQRK